MVEVVRNAVSVVGILTCNPDIKRSQNNKREFRFRVTLPHYAEGQYSCKGNKMKLNHFFFTLALRRIGVAIKEIY